MDGMTSRQRLLTAINRGVPDRLPVTTHHLMPYFSDTYMHGLSPRAFFDSFGLDAIHWTWPSPALTCQEWRVEVEEVPNPRYVTQRYRIVTPGGVLTTVLQSNVHTSWLAEYPIKDKGDIDLLARYQPSPLCDVATVNREAEEFGERGLVRGSIPGFPLFGQPGCWQDAACLVGTEKLILATFDDPGWVHLLLGILLEKKKVYVQSLAGARYDLLELGGGDASTTVISPSIFDRFVAPYDEVLISLAHQVGQKIVYHVCGGMMPILEAMADLGADAVETLTPPDMGGDVDLAEAKRRIGNRVCLIGGFDQGHHLHGCSEEVTRQAVRRCFEQAGANGGYILAPSDHFFDADPVLLRAFADEAHRCLY
jgi:uroporphyrinogen-III decarboxylase